MVIEKIKDKKIAIKKNEKMLNQIHQDNEENQKTVRTGQRYWYSPKKKIKRTIRMIFSSPEKNYRKQITVKIIVLLDTLQKEIR